MLPLGYPGTAQLSAFALLSLGLVDLARAECRATYSPCIPAESAPRSPFALSFHALPEPANEEELARGGVGFGYQARTLVATAASPDPFGREVPILDDWIVAEPFLVWRLTPRWSVAAQQPVTLSQSGLGVSGVTTIDAPEPPVAAGDTVLSASFSQALGATHLTLFAGQRITLPTGHAQSFLKEQGPSYSPSLALHYTLDSLTLGALAGLQLRRAVSFGELRFGPEAILGAGAAVSLGQATLGTEFHLRPALLSDVAAPGAVRHRLPATLLLNLGYPTADIRLGLSLGTSLPLSRVAGSGDQGSGPPGSVFRLNATVSYVFR